MFGIIVFFLCIAGLWHVLRRPRSPVRAWWGRAEESDGLGYQHRARYGREWLRRTLVDLDATPTQERAIFDAIDQAIDEVHESASSILAVRKRVAAVFRRDSLSTEEIQAALDDESGSLQRAREAIGNALASIHGVLDDRQRRVLARRLQRPHVIY